MEVKKICPQYIVGECVASNQQEQFFSAREDRQLRVQLQNLGGGMTVGGMRW